MTALFLDNDLSDAFIPVYVVEYCLDMKRDFRLIVADIDRTLRIKGESLSDLNREAFKALHEKGILLGLASGRPLWQGVEKIYQEWDLGFQFDLLIGMNGGEIYDVNRNERTILNLLDTDTMRYITEQMSEFGCHPFIYREGYMLATGINGRILKSVRRNNNELKIVDDISELLSEPTGKILYGTDTPEELIPMEEKGRTFIEKGISCFKTDIDLLEFQNFLNNKGVALEHYCLSNDIDLKDVIAFGDAENDIEMMEKAGYSVCLCNGMEKAKAVADAITEYDAGNSGFGHYVYDHLL